MKISSIKEMRKFLIHNSGFSELTIDAVIEALGYSPQGSSAEFRELSALLEQCAEHGADVGFSGFTYYSETIEFFTSHRRDIVSHMEQASREMGIDIISMVQGFGVFQHGSKPTAEEVGKALWDSGETWDELTSLYNVFAWYALEEVSRAWYMYLEENPAYHAELSA